jgi:hypothetical protein
MAEPHQFCPTSQFCPVVHPVPPAIPMTDAEKEQEGQSRNIPRDKWPLLTQQPVLCLPNTALCSRYVRWLHTNRCLPKGASVLLTHQGLYTSRFSHAAARYQLTNPHTAHHQDRAVEIWGRPMSNWQFVASHSEDSG